MKHPKKIYINADDLTDDVCQFIEASTHDGNFEYISVDALKKWITENTSTAENQAGELIIYVDRLELFTFIEDENS